MTRRLAVLLWLVVLAVPAAADARSKRVKVRLPAEGDISVARYMVTTANPDGVTIRRSPRLGDAVVATAGRRLSRRRHEVTVMLANPQGGASASQEGETIVDLIFRELSPPVVQVYKTAEVDNALTQPATPKETRAVNGICRRPPPRSGRRSARRFFSSRGRGARLVRGSFATALCQQGNPTETTRAADALRDLGVSVPACTGTAASDPADSKQAVVTLTCSQPTEFVAIRGQDGNDALECRGPEESVCACGPACTPLPVESSCFFDRDGFALGASHEFRTHWREGANLADIRASTRAPGSRSVDDFRFGYLRYIVR
jgi:hypothetical protein